MVKYYNLARYWVFPKIGAGPPNHPFSILIGLSIINHPFWGTPIFGNTHMQTHHFRAALAAKPEFSIIPRAHHTTFLKTVALIEVSPVGSSGATVDTQKVKFHSTPQVHMGSELGCPAKARPMVQWLWRCSREYQGYLRIISSLQLFLATSLFAQKKPGSFP